MQKAASPSILPLTSSETQRAHRFKLLEDEARDAGWVDTPDLPERLGAAERLRERLSGVLFYANRAAKAQAETGDEMSYWLSLQGSQMTAHRR
jgi:hypothetical protein